MAAELAMGRVICRNGPESDLAASLDQNGQPGVQNSDPSCFHGCVNRLTAAN